MAEQTELVGPVPVRAVGSVLAVAGFANLRDVGGLPARGGVTRWRTLLRGDLPSGGDDVVAGLRALGVRTVVDLRDPDEALLEPAPWLGELPVVSAPVLGGGTVEMVAAGAALPDVYAAIVDQRGRSLAAAVRSVADAGAAGGAVLLHCSAGKDRTGLVVALLLELLGVPRRAVLDDYARSEELLQGRWLRRRIAELQPHHSVDLRERAELLAGSPRPALAAALARVELTHGSVRAYLTHHGLTDGDVVRLRRFLVGAQAVVR